MRRIAVVVVALAAWAGGQCARTAVVSALDAHGAPLTDVAAADLQAKAKGGPVAITRLRAVAAPRVILLFDASGSMGTRADWVQAAFEAALQSLPPAHWAVLRFAAGPLERSPISGAESEAVADLFRQLGNPASYRGETALYDTIAEAARAIRAVGPGDALVLVSDGNDDSSRRQPRQVAALLAPDGPTLYWLLLESFTRDPVLAAELGPPPAETAHWAAVAKLAEDSGGFVDRGPENAPATAAMKRAVVAAEMRRIAAAILARKLATVVAASAAKPLRWRLSLTKAYRKRHRDAVVFAPKWLPACAAR